MAKLSFLLQAATSATHAASLKRILSMPYPEQLLISVAFAREAGVEALEENLAKLGSKTRAFVGIRNDITSVQAIKRLLALGVQVYAVDTGSRHIIFHPKIYLLVTRTASFALIGSANLTFNGLHNNVEVSTSIELEEESGPDQEFIREILTNFEQLIQKHPQHVFKITNQGHVDELFLAGRLVDENIIRAPSPIATVKASARDIVPPMRLAWTPSPSKTGTAPLQNALSINSGHPPSALTPSTSAQPLTSAAGTKYLVWKSKPLSERDLNIPSGENTNVTGSMGLKKGLFDQIDQRHYFHDTVFAGLAWSVGTRTTIVKTEAQFEIIIANISYGSFSLTISHNTSTTSATYLQNNFVSNLHWNNARQHIAKPDLLGRTLSLFREDSAPPKFVIEID